MVYWARCEEKGPEKGQREESQRYVNNNITPMSAAARVEAQEELAVPGAGYERPRIEIVKLPDIDICAASGGLICSPFTDCDAIYCASYYQWGECVGSNYCSEIAGWNCYMQYN